MAGICPQCGSSNCMGHRPTSSGSVGPPTQLTRERELMAQVAELKGKLATAQPVLNAARLWMSAKIGSRESMGALMEMTRATRAYLQATTP